jgi:hypothetical protein
MKRAAIASIAVVVALGTLLGTSAAARADDCPPAGVPWLRVAFSGDALDAALRGRVLVQLAADLRSHGLSLCPTETADATAGAPLADVALALSSGAVLSLEVRDAVTEKRMARELPLASVPHDALALSIALAAEELLRASWIEAEFARTSSASTGPSVPQVVHDVNAEQVAKMPIVARVTATAKPRATVTTDVSESASPSASRSPLSAQLAVVGAIEHSAGGQTDLGGDVRFSVGGRLAATARIGYRAAPDVTSAHGVVQGSEILAGLAVAYALLRRENPWGIELGARADVIDVLFSGIASTPGTQGTSGSALGATLSGVVGGWLRLSGSWRVVGEVAAGAPIRAVAATDLEQTATGVSGFTFGGALGIAATLGD